MTILSKCLSNSEVLSTRPGRTMAPTSVVHEAGTSQTILIRYQGPPGFLGAFCRADKGGTACTSSIPTLQGVSARDEVRLGRKIRTNNQLSDCVALVNRVVELVDATGQFPRGGRAW